MKKILLFSALTIFFSSCSDNRNRGCTDPTSINFESWADYDDGSCLFEADIVFFYDNITANELNFYSDLLLGAIDRLDYYIEETPGTFIHIGSEYPTPLYMYAGVPNCYEATYITETIQWYNHNNTVINYIVYGIHEVGLLEFETIVDEYSFTLYTNECAAVPIRFLTKKKKE